MYQEFSFFNSSVLTIEFPTIGACIVDIQTSGKEKKKKNNNDVGKYFQGTYILLNSCRSVASNEASRGGKLRSARWHVMRMKLNFKGLGGCILGVLLDLNLTLNK